MFVILFAGDPISCITDNGVPGHVINTYCWITSTFTLPHQQGKPVGTHVAHPGVGTYVEHENETRYHSYYQWVPFMLFFQVTKCLTISDTIKVHDYNSGKFTDTPHIPAVYQILVTQNIDEMCFFAKESIKILNVSPTNQLRKC